MSRRPKRTKPDANQGQIIKDLLKLGFDVDDVHDLPGLYDLVVSGNKKIKRAGRIDQAVGPYIYVICSVRVEVKSEKGKLSKSEQEYFDKQNHRNAYLIARCAEDVLAWFGR